MDKLKKFKEHLQECTLDIMDHGYDKKYDVTITVNGQSLVIDLNADLYMSLVSIIDEEIIQLGE